MPKHLDCPGIPAKIADIDLGPIMVKAMIEEKATLEEASLGARELRRFYALHKKYPDEPLSPSRLMDKIWHLHILDTIYYPGDCDAMFGHYLDHFPYLGLRGKDDAIELKRTFDRTKELYEREFGETMPQAFNGTICGGGCVLESIQSKTECGIEDSKSQTKADDKLGHCVKTGPKEARIKCCSGPAPAHLPPRPTLEAYLAQL